MPESRQQRRLATILAADVVGYTRAMALDEAGTLAQLKNVAEPMRVHLLRRDGNRPAPRSRMPM